MTILGAKKVNGSTRFITIANIKAAVKAEMYSLRSSMGGVCHVLSHSQTDLFIRGAIAGSGRQSPTPLPQRTQLATMVIAWFRVWKDDFSPID